MDTALDKTGRISTITDSAVEARTVRNEVRTGPNRETIMTGLEHFIEAHRDGMVIVRRRVGNKPTEFEKGYLAALEDVLQGCKDFRELDGINQTGEINESS